MSIIAADGPSVADWLEAWATVAGAMLSGAAVLIALVVLRSEQRSRREDKNDADAVQARVVLVRAVGARGNPDEGWKGITYQLNNNSSGEVSELLVGAQRVDSDRRYASATVRRIKSMDSHEDELDFDTVVPWPFDFYPAEPDDVAYHTAMSVAFTDSAGLRWSRRDREEPKRIRGDKDRSPRYRVYVLLADYFYLTKALRFVAAGFRRCRLALEHSLSHRLAQRNIRSRRGEAGNDEAGSDKV
jgi:hypothetical protein